MKKLLFIAMLASLFFSCSKEDLGTVNAVLGQEIRLKEGQAALYNNSGIEAASAVKLQVERVADSRCPSDVVCVTYGRVEVTLKLGAVDGSGQSITMCLGACDSGSQSSDVAEIVVGATPYSVKLMGVTPLPKHKDKSRITKEVQLVVERS